jgi:hypothetical protein
MQLRRQPRRTLALAAGALLLGSPVLTSCGFDYATDRVYTPANGANDRDASVDVLGAVVVAAQDDSGTFIAALSNNDNEKPTRLDSFDGGEKGDLSASGFSPVKIPAAGLVNLANDGGVAVTGDFKPGDFVSVKLGFATGEDVSVEVPVVTACGYYTDLDTSASSGSASAASSSSSSSASPSASASQSASGSASEGSSASDSASPSDIGSALPEESSAAAAPADQCASPTGAASAE